jgi:hypothetical protein
MELLGLAGMAWTWDLAYCKGVRSCFFFLFLLLFLLIGSTFSQSFFFLCFYWTMDWKHGVWISQNMSRTRVCNQRETWYQREAFCERPWLAHVCIFFSLSLFFFCVFSLFYLFSIYFILLWIRIRSDYQPLGFLLPLHDEAVLFILWHALIITLNFFPPLIKEGVCLFIAISI